MRHLLLSLWYFYHSRSLIAVTKELDAGLVHDLLCHLGVLLRDLNQIVEHVIVLQVLILSGLDHAFADVCNILKDIL